MIREEVSVIMPAYNAEQFIAESINSVIDQTFTNWELIIINDGSTDNTKLIAEDYAAKDNRIKVINQPNKKLGAARNAGIANAAGKWIAFLDADDLWTKDKLEKQLQASVSQPTAGLIFSDGSVFYNTIDNILPYETVRGLYPAPAMYKLQYKGNHIPVLSVMVKKEHLNAIGLQDERTDLYGCEDWDYWLRLCLQGVSFYGMDDKLFYYRRHSANMSNDDSLMRFAKSNVLLKNFRQELLNREETLSLKSFINITICQFVNSGKIREALTINKRTIAYSKTSLVALGDFLISILKKRSYYPLRSLFKLDRLLSLSNA